ncbi:MAG: LytTR family DNA-binding domain-containing protein [Eubacteriales bacterium]|nr:LytTR family DNA-binding domain-containing protein [Eubacteriales bacterium]
MKIAICDDDAFIIKQLTELTDKFFKTHKLKLPELVNFSNGEALLEQSEGLDIVFLDISMPGIDGITAGSRLMKRNPHMIIFIVTAYPQYLDDAMRFHVFRYLSKPIEPERLFKNLEDALKQYNISDNMLTIELRQGVVNVPSNDIIYIESSNRKVTLYTNNQEYASIKPMSYWIDVTRNIHCFYQTHGSFIINMKYITSFNKSVVYLYNNQFQAFITQRNYTKFKTAYLLYLESMR